MPRLFVAVDLPDDAKREVVALCHGIPDVRWIPPSQLHLTIHFIGEVDVPKLAAIKTALAGETLPPFVCQLQGVGRFPPKGRPRVLWAGVHAEAGLLRLVAMVARRLAVVGLVAEERPFFPHITLTRLKDVLQEPIVSYVSKHAEFHTDPFTVREFHLYSSLLTARGAVHDRVQSYPLA